jgi:hypothetical protein
MFLRTSIKPTFHGDVIDAWKLGGQCQAVCFDKGLDKIPNIEKLNRKRVTEKV